VYHWRSEGGQVSVNSLITTYGCFQNRATTIPPCSPYNALAAVDVKPDRVQFLLRPGRYLPTIWMSRRTSPNASRRAKPAATTQSTS